MLQPQQAQKSLPERLKTLLLSFTETACSCYYLGQLEQALQVLQLGTPLLQFSEVTEQDRAYFLLHQGNMLRARTQFQNAPVEEAIIVLEEVKQLATVLHDELLRAAALDGLGFAYYVAASNRHEGNPHQFRAYFQEALELRSALLDEQGVSESLFHLGLVADVLDEREAAHAFYTQALQRAQQQNYPEIIAETQRHLGFHAQAEGDFPKAQQHFSEALHILQQMGAQMLLPFANIVLVDICLKQGDLKTASSYSSNALDLSRKMDLKRAYIFALLAAARLCQQKQEEEQAKSYFSEAYMLAKAIDLRSALQQVPRALLGLPTFSPPEISGPH